MNLFFSTHIDQPLFNLLEEESRHIVKVLRLKSGDEIYVTDGKGNLCQCLLMDQNPKACSVRIVNIKSEYERRTFSLNIAIAPVKNINRFEWFLEKCTEIGIDEITPLICEHSERHNINSERLNKVLIAALKQSYKSYLPKLNPIISFTDFMKSNINAQKYIAVCEEQPGKRHLKDLYKASENAVIMIGPEGDFSTGEIKVAIDNGYLPVSLSNSRLRTETAGIVACEIINLIND